jgi:hypothetical protein
MNEIFLDPHKKLPDNQSNVNLHASDGSFGEILAELDINEAADVSFINSLETRDMGKQLSLEFYTRLNKSISSALKAEGLG